MWEQYKTYKYNNVKQNIIFETLKQDLMKQRNSKCTSYNSHHLMVKCYCMLYLILQYRTIPIVWIHNATVSPSSSGMWESPLLGFLTWVSFYHRSNSSFKFLLVSYTPFVCWKTLSSMRRNHLTGRSVIGGWKQYVTTVERVTTCVLMVGSRNTKPKRYIE
jgi:hypothetical protein